jgi:hypothetical protein
MNLLFVDLYSEIWPHSMPTALIAEQYVSNGHRVHYLNCDGKLSSYCIAMSARGLNRNSNPSEMSSTCSSCRKRRNLIQKEFGFEKHTLEELVNDKDEKKIEEIVRSTTSDNWTEVILDGIYLGRVAAYEFFLEKKFNSPIIPIKFFNEYLERLENTIAVYIACKKLIESNDIDAVFAYNGLYSTNRVSLLCANELDKQAWSLHAGSHLEKKYSTLSMYRFDTLPVRAYESHQWMTTKEQPLSIEKIELVEKHIQLLIRATNNFVYSTKGGVHDEEEIRRILGIKNSAKVLVATMSSGDEFLAAQLAGLLPTEPSLPTLFADASEWISWLISAVGEMPDIHLIVRVHPREFPNKRESVESYNAVKLRALFEVVPSNVTINWPSDGISLYDLVKVTDLTLNSTSTAGLEMSLFGVPVLLHDTEFMLAYDPKINTICYSKLEYRDMILNLVAQGKSIEQTRKAFRWLAFVFSNVQIDIADGFSYPSDGFISNRKGIVPSMRNSVLKNLQRYLPPIYERNQLRNRASLRNGMFFESILHQVDPILIRPSESSNNSEADETVELKMAVNRLFSSL